MLACLSCPPDSFILRRTQCYTSYSTSRLRFDSQEALFFLQKCINFDQLKQVHGKIIRHGLHHDQLLVRKLLHLCSSYGKIEYASLVFNQLQMPLTYTWNIMIRLLSEYGNSKQAILLYNRMICKACSPDKFTFPFVIKACLGSSDINKGKEVHGLAIKTDFSGDIFVQHTLMDLYFKSGHLKCGCKVFDKMTVRNVVSWTTMITGFIACGELNAAQRVFDEMPTRNVVSWTAMIDGYVRNDRPQEAFEMFHRMQADNVRPNEFTLVSLLRASTELGSLKLGCWIHDFSLKNGFKLGVYLGTALIDMYSKCNSIKDARKVFDMMQTRSIATWNSMITSLGVHGYGEEALALFAQMEKENIQPDAITFLGVLCACVQTNNIIEGYRYFNYMKEHYGIEPIPEHYACIFELCIRSNISNETSAMTICEAD